MMISRNRCTRRLAPVLAFMLAVAPALPRARADDAPPAPAQERTQVQAQPDSAGDTPSVDVRKLFAAQCSWCHGAYGMKADKGPRLAGTQMTEKQVHDRIMNGKPGAMPSFRKVLTEEQVAAFARYIKSLKPEPED